MRLVFTFFAILSTFSLWAQVDFRLASDQEIGGNINGVLPMATADFNGDGREDLLVSPLGDSLKLHLQKKNGGFIIVNLDPLPDNSVSGSLWALAAADIDGDGWTDVVAGFGKTLYLLQNHLYENRFEYIPIMEDVFTQNVSIADWNQNGLLDIFACDDIGYNVLLEANKSTRLIDFTRRLDDNSLYSNGGNYGSAFNDVDNDGDLDLYVAKCKQGDEDPASPDRINLLYLNEGGQLIEEESDRGLSSGAQTWTATFGDLDNDLDLDMVMTNHTDSNMILVNDGFANYTSIYAPTFPTTSFSLQSLVRDFDNNGFMDIYITGAVSRMFFNQGGYEFVSYTLSGRPKNALSAVTADLNHDGFLDIYTSYGNIFVLPSLVPDELFINEGNNNHWVIFDIEGVESEFMGTGARIEVYSSGQSWMREFTIGDSYGITNGTNVHFGLGEASVIDSVLIHWPRTGVQRFYDLQPDQYYYIDESCGIKARVEISSEEIISICDGESVSLKGIDGFSSYRWNNGDTTQSIVISESGFYQVRMRDANGCWIVSKTVFVEKNPRPEAFLVNNINDDNYVCTDTEVQLCVQTDSDVEWNTGSMDSCILVEDDGLYSVSVQGVCQDYSLPAYSINFIAAATPEWLASIYEEESDDWLIELAGEAIVCYSDSLLLDQVVGTGNVIRVGGVTNDTVIYCRQESVTAPTINAGKIDITGSGGQNRPNLPDAGLNFMVAKKFYLDSVDVFCYVENDASLRIRNEVETTLFEQTYSLKEGWNRLPVSYYFDELGSYSILFSGNPYCHRSTSNFEYPIEIGDGFGEITESRFGESEYYYFYNWQVTSYKLDCKSDLLSVRIEPVSNIEVSELDFRLAPNPVHDLLRIDLPTNHIFHYEIQSINHTILRQSSISIQQPNIDLSAFAPGVYIFHLYHENGQYIDSRKIIKTP